MKRVLPFFALLAIVLVSIAVRSRNLGAMSLSQWDESYHALVAKNLLSHPLTPTLIDNPAFDASVLPLSPRWVESTVWFHKGTLPFWIAAAGMEITGPVPLGFRAASLVLSLGSTVLLFFLGSRLFSPRAGVIAASLLAVNPYFTGQIHGIMLTDIVDTTLLFFVLAGLLALAYAAESGKPIHAAAAGAASGLAFMSKYYLGLVVPAVAVLLILVDGDARRNLFRSGPMAAFVGGAMIVLVPWAGYFYSRFPSEFSQDVLYYFGHIMGNTENWGAPWDRYVFDYLPNAARDAFVPGLFAGAVLWTVPRHRRTGTPFAFVWLLAAAVPHVLAKTKVPSYGVLASPALILLTAALLDDALRYDGRTLAIAAGAFAAALFFPPNLPGILCWGRGPGPSHSLFSIAMTKPWIGIQAIVIVTVAAVVAMAQRALRSSFSAPWVFRAVRVFCVAGLVVVLWRQARESRELTLRHPSASNLLAIADFARTTDPQSVFFLTPGTVEHTSFMFYASRTAYPANARSADRVLPNIAANRPVFLLSKETNPSAIFTAPDGSAVTRLR